MTERIASARQSRNSEPYFTAETQSSQRSEYFLIKNSLLCALRASAVRYPNSSHEEKVRQLGTHASAPRTSVNSRGSLTHHSPPSELAKSCP